MGRKNEFSKNLVMKHTIDSLVLSALVLALAGNAAANQTWTGTGPDRDWNNPANWLGSPSGTPNAVPSITEKANIWNAPGPVVDSPTPTILQLDIGSSAGTALDIGAGGTLTVNDWFIIGYGAGQTGTFNVNGGATSLPVGGKDITIGFNGTGNVVMADGSITIADDLFFGTGATGVGNLSMSNGTVSVNDDVSIGNVAGGKGYFTMSGGMLTNFDDLFIGDNGTGEMTMTGTPGATITSKTGTGHDLIVGRNAGSNGKLNMSSGSVTINGIGYIGQNGTGLLDMTGGTFTASSVLVIGRNNGSSGEVLLKGGTIRAANLEFTNGVQVALLAHLDITGGKLVLTGNQVNRINGFIDTGNLTTAYGDSDLLHVDYHSDTDVTTVTAESATFRLLITPNGANYDFTWDSRNSKIYDLVSSTDLTTPIIEWPVYKGHANIQGTAPSNTLTNVVPSDSTRFFAVVERDAPPLLAEDFEGVTPPGPPADWAGSDNGAGTAWQVGTPTGAATGPDAAANGTQCAGTNIGGNYTASAEASLVTKAFTVPASGATLKFSQYIDTELAAGGGDFGSIRLLNAGDNSVLAGGDVATALEGTTEAWSSKTLPFPAAANGLEVKLEFRFSSNASAEFAGFYIDDVVVSGN
jgi:hypothetical protein